MRVGPTFLVSVGSIGLVCYLTVLLSRRRSMPTAKPLLGVGVLSLSFLLLHTALYVSGPLRAVTEAITGRAFVFQTYFHLQALYTGSVGTLWFLFSLQYTGRGERFATRAARVLGVFWLVTIGIVTVSWLTGARYGEQAVFELVLSLSLFTLSALFIMGVFLVAETAWRRNAVGTREAGLLAGGATTIALVSVLSAVFTHPVVPPIVVCLGSLQFVVAVRWFPVFDALPVARIEGRDRLLAERADPVLVVDRTNRIRDLNESAEETFGVDREDALRSRLDTLLHTTIDPKTVAQRSDPVHIQPTEQTILAITADQVTDDRGRQFGHVLNCTDITDQQRRERRLSLLYQLLAGRLQEELSAIVSTAENLAAKPTDGAVDAGDQSPDTAARGDPSALGSEISDTVANLKTLVARTRDVERSLAELELESVSLGQVIDSAIPDSEEGDRRVERHLPDEPVRATVDAAVLEQVLSMLLSDLLEATDGVVSVSLDPPGDGGEIRLSASGVEQFDHFSSEGDVAASQVELTLEIAQVALQTLGGTVETVSHRDQLTVVLDLQDEQAERPHPSNVRGGEP